MIGGLIKKVFGTSHEREIKRLRPRVVRINDLEEKWKKLSDAELRGKTAEFRTKLDNGATLDDLLEEAFATVREASRRAIGLRHYDVQMIGGAVLHRGAIAEMKTGEGKTLVATCPMYLNALEGRGVHLITVNDYLATRDAEWMGRIYKFLGMTVGTIVHGQSDKEKQLAYRCDITYGTNNEFGFDYLRDNMKDSIERYVQRELHYAIVDEVDSILIDEARTPLIISGPAEDSADLYHRVNMIIPSLKKDIDFTVDEKAHSVMLTDEGVGRVEKKLGLVNLYDPGNIAWLHHVTKALQAHALYKRDVNYLVEDGKVKIIDEHTGRKMEGRRWSDGLHQAIEAKENVTVEEENQTLATVTFQNLFRMYHKLAGMTGTADTEAEEFHHIYKLDVVQIPTNMPMIRIDNADLIYKNERGKFRAVLGEIVERHEKGQPILVGTISVEKSEVLSSMLKKKGIEHVVLNAKYHMREAEIVAQAGRKSAVTISTNMAGRGTDVLLGGNAEFMARAEVAGHEAAAIPGSVDESTPEYKAALTKFKAQCEAEKKEVLAAGGLHILGTERHESRRIDNQLRGRSGRQGDPGSSRFYLSLEDDLLRIFGAERITGLMERLGMEEDVPIEHGLVNRAIENAQRKVEGHNFDIRKNLLDYDDVMNQQRKAIYSLRKQILEGRYQPTLTEAEIKKGKEPPPPPTSSGEWTIESLADKIKPRVAQIIDSFLAGVPKGPDGTVDPYRTDANAPAAEAQVLDPEKLTHELYRVFGAVVDVKKDLGEREALVRKAATTAAASLIQQRERVLDLADELISTLVWTHCPEKAHADEWDLKALADGVKEQFNVVVNLDKVAILEREVLAETIWDQVHTFTQARETELGPLAFFFFARHFYLEEIDSQWIDHLKSMDHLREGIGLRGYGQKDPKIEYKKEGYELFRQMMERISSSVAAKLYRVTLQRQVSDAAPQQKAAAEEKLPEFKHKERKMTLQHPGASPSGDGQAAGEPEKQKTVRREQPKVGRNEPCPCGSGKKYKKCHGATAVA
ncbi:MAG TPA: preprotein translocase subunit SecA [Polyangia bacterium]|nr:preprotein translocase subunit SecA [Polyangia bacterium]